MDKELLALAEEYSKYNKELPSLRSEYNFLIEDIDRKKLMLEAVEPDAFVTYMFVITIP
jgi:hypothetical protein